jgi:hypothetical protein
MSDLSATEQQERWPAWGPWEAEQSWVAEQWEARIPNA